MLNVFKSRSYGSLGITSVLILAFLIGFLAFKARNDQWNIWKLNENITFYNGSPLFTTADAPYFVGKAKVINEGGTIQSFYEKRAFPQWDSEIGYNAKVEFVEPGIFEISLLPRTISYISKFFDNNVLLASNTLIPIAAFLTAVSIFVFFFCLGFGYEGAIAGIGASLSQSIFIRTSVGRVDTDLLNIGFFYAIAAFVFASVKSNNFRNKMIFISIAGLASFFFNWWYLRPGFLILFLSTLLILQIYYRQNFRIFVFQILLFTFLSGPNYVLVSVDNVFNFAEVYLNFSTNLEKVSYSGLNFPNTFITISELQKLNLEEYSRDVFGRGKEWVFLLGIIGLLLFSVFNFGRTLGMVPALVFLILSIFVGKRFAIYAVPLYWFGFAYLLSTLILFLNEIFKLPKIIKINDILVKVFLITSSTVSLIFVIITTSLADCENDQFFDCKPRYVPTPTFSTEITEGFDYFKVNNFDTSSIIVTWWDYGYWLNLFSGLTNVHDGGSQRSVKTYLVANSLTSTSQEKSYDMIKYLTSSTIDKVNKDSSQDYNFFINQVSNSKKIDRPIYLFLTRDMIRWWGSISYIGDWDIVKGRKVNQRSFVRVDCKPKSKFEMVCGDTKDSILNVNDGSISNGHQLDSLVIIQNGKLIRRFDYKDKKGKTSMLIDIVDGKRFFYVVHPDTLNSTFSNLFFLNLPKNNMFSLVEDKYPHYRIFKVE